MGRGPVVVSNRFRQPAISQIGATLVEISMDRGDQDKKFKGQPYNI